MAKWMTRLTRMTRMTTFVVVAIYILLAKRQYGLFVTEVRRDSCEEPVVPPATSANRTPA